MWSRRGIGVVDKLSANQRKRRRAKKTEPRQSGAELPDAGAEREPSDQEVEGPLESESNEPKPQSELKSSERKLILPAELEAERQTPELAQAEPAQRSKRAEVKPEGQKSGGKRVADNREGVFESFSKVNESVFSLDGVKKAAAWYIETSEKLANQALEFQERATGWAKDTPFAPLFEAQHSIARKFVERSANAARTLWQIHPNQ
jgi:hypothetical protein